MAKFFGYVGYSNGSVETKPGVYVEDIHERRYYGDVMDNTYMVREGERVNDDISLSQSISIVCDGYANEHIFAIRYVELAGTFWDVTSVKPEGPRLILRLGGVYNGPKPNRTS